MSGFKEAVTIPKSVNDLVQKIIPWDDSAALLSQKNGFLSRYKYPQRGKNILPYKPHQEYHSERQPGFTSVWADLFFSPSLSNSSSFKNVYEPSVMMPIVFPDVFQVIDLRNK